MAKIVLDGMFRSIQGRIGDYVFRTSPAGETIISRVPDMSNVKWSKAQRAHRRQFKKANEYAKAAMQDPERSAYFEREGSRLNKRPYNLAISHYFKTHDTDKK